MMQLRGVYLSIASCGNLRCHFLNYLEEGGRFLEARDWRRRWRWRWKSGGSGVVDS